MPKLGRSVCKEPELHRRGVIGLLDLIAKAHAKSRGDIVIAYHEDISVYAVRMWLERTIPKKHWAKLSGLSGLPLEQIEKIATQYFETEYSEG